jgi:hypothetical protein
MIYVVDWICQIQDGLSIQVLRVFQSIIHDLYISSVKYLHLTYLYISSLNQSYMTSYLYIVTNLAPTKIILMYLYLPFLSLILTSFSFLHSITGPLNFNPISDDDKFGEIILMLAKSTCVENTNYCKLHRSSI